MTSAKEGKRKKPPITRYKPRKQKQQTRKKDAMIWELEGEMGGRRSIPW